MEGEVPGIQDPRPLPANRVRGCSACQEAVPLTAASGDRAQEAWSAVACGLRNVLAPVWLLHLRNQENLTQQLSVCFRSVWGSCGNQACLTETQPRKSSLFLHPPPQSTDHCQGEHSERFPGPKTEVQASYLCRV